MVNYMEGIAEIYSLETRLQEKYLNLQYVDFHREKSPRWKYKEEAEVRRACNLSAWKMEAMGSSEVIGQHENPSGTRSRNT